MQEKSNLKKGADFIGTSVSYLCHDGNGNFLFNKRSINCRDEHGNWDNGGGGIDFGDTVIETLAKEIKEEYGIEPLKYTFLGYRDVLRTMDGIRTHWITLDFFVLVDRNKVINGEPHKFDAVEWFTLENLPSPLHSQFPKFLEQYKEKISL